MIYIKPTMAIWLTDRLFPYLIYKGDFQVSWPCKDIAEMQTLPVNFPWSSIFCADKEGTNTGIFFWKPSLYLSVVLLSSIYISYSSSWRGSQTFLYGMLRCFKYLDAIHSQSQMMLPDSWPHLLSCCSCHSTPPSWCSVFLSCQLLPPQQNEDYSLLLELATYPYGSVLVLPERTAAFIFLFQFQPKRYGKH